MKTVTKKPAKVKDEFVITITIENVVYEGKGATALAALQAIPTPELITTGTLVIVHGDKKKEMLYPGQQLKRLFNPYNQDFLVNDIIFGMS